MEGFQKKVPTLFLLLPSLPPPFSLLEFPHGEGGKLFRLFARNMNVGESRPCPLVCPPPSPELTGRKTFPLEGRNFFPSHVCAVSGGVGGWVGRWAPAGCGIKSFGFIKSTYF